MLERDPKDRPRSAGEVLEPLLAFREALRTGEEPTLPLSISNPGRSNRRGWLFASAAAVALLVAAGTWLNQKGTGEAVPRVAVLPFTALSEGADDASIAAGIHAELLTRLTQVSGCGSSAATRCRGMRGGKGGT